MNSKFSIKKLECRYKNSTVFYAENIEIPKDKLTIIIGPSGSGKTTFIEALGLMNKTMTDDSEVFFNSDNKYDKYVEKKRKSQGIRLNSLWAKTDAIQKNLVFKILRLVAVFLSGDLKMKRKARNEIRGKGYSFVFQDTYLMPNFSAIDNIALTDLIKGNPLAKSYHKIIGSLVKNLHLKTLFFKNKPSEYSGGERQRMAFGRGIFPDFEVLFGDEPTGNLDPHNANEVLKYAKECIKKKAGRSAIIVTHSIDLALQFADKIIVLTPILNLNGRKMYTVLPEFTFHRIDWENTNAQHFREKIDFLINSDNSEVVLRLSEDIVANKVEFDEVIFEKYSSLPTQTNTNQVNVDDLIKKVVCEVPMRKTRNALINEFQVEDGILINYKGKSDLWDPKKSIFQNVLFLFHRATLRTFKVLIKAEIALLKKIWKNHGNLKPDFLNIFVYNELKEFFGRTFPKNLIFVLFIQFLIFYLIGTANGILDFVARQDKNPFVNTINISSNYPGIEGLMGKVQEDISYPDTTISIKNYGIDTITYFKQESTNFNFIKELNYSDSTAEYFWESSHSKQLSVKSMQSDDPMRGTLLQIETLRPYGSDFVGDDDFSVIVTRAALAALEQKDSTYIIRTINVNGEKFKQPLPIRGIVDQLPGGADVVCLDNLYHSIFFDDNWELAKDQFVLWIKMDSKLLIKFDSILMNKLDSVSLAHKLVIKTKNSKDPVFGFVEENKIIKQIRNISDLYEYRICVPNITKEINELIYDNLINCSDVIKFLKENKISKDRIQLSYLNTIGGKKLIDYDNANIYVSRYDSIYNFSQKVSKISNLSLNMENIERIKNYNIMKWVTIMLSAFLLIFSILIITILLSNILSNHLNSIKKNIGLLMAFGVDTKVIYQCIMGSFIILTLLAGIGLSYLIGDYCHFNKIIFEFLTGFVLPKFSGFTFFQYSICDTNLICKFISNPTVITIFLMLVISLFRFNYIINQIFKETPGNLIYDKSNKG
ncbi:MAG: ATP-binding cassette domain-containing protein [Prolixibacteraceae bacterium]|nr:ATP-binding cassette domain-containing protein [Prolixibacteraceae bacterium]